jgi:hypothetical protein
MKTLKRSKVLGAMLGGLTALGMIGTAQASSHREEPSGGPNFFKFSDDVLYEVHITKPGIAGPDGGANATYTFDDQAYYQFRFKTAPIARVEPGPDAGLGGGVEFFAQLTGTYNQSYTVTKIDGNGVATDLTPAGGLKVAPPNIGPVTDQLANGLPSGRHPDLRGPPRRSVLRRPRRHLRPGEPARQGDRPGRPLPLQRALGGHADPARQPPGRRHSPGHRGR